MRQFAGRYTIEGCIKGIYTGITLLYTNSMTTIKTAVSIEESLFRRIEEEAEAREISRSGLISLAVESYLSRLEAERITVKLNEVYANGPDEEDLQWLEAAQAAYMETLGEEEW